MKTIAVIFLLITGLLCVSTFLLFKSNMALRASIKISENKYKESLVNDVSLKLRDIKRDVNRDLEEKYQADIVSYKVMIDKLKREEEIRKGLEENLKKIQRKEEYK
jgi:Tfp pilus assembly ATPase PilU